ncbi:maleylpyruvate isomerase N-terminal domain-containing protein [Streptosporangium sp. NBC_01639]|uniref:maleylpyruvate isomerase family mycothiol-dependent enzyme n=1 Tax=Streptosporangium sp. NBC_01639 TaxID=2975948 RepID=UPI0038635B6E|nr:maleylpyruvate isomerase N-terminal domain-containing protein [Streptosporangium sp. NBC_01639]
MVVDSSRLILTEKTGLSCGPEALHEALYMHRKRLVGRLAELTPADWAAPTRCPQWSVHEVVRHIVDVAEYHVTQLAKRPEPTRFDRFGPFNPVSTPVLWLQDSAGQSPEQTVESLLRVIEEEHDILGARIDEGGAALERSAAGREILWHVQSLHIMWDAWLHERDMAETLGAGEPPDATVQSLVALYSLLIAGGVATVFGDTPQVSFHLTGSPDGVYEISGHRDDVRVAVGSDSPSQLNGPFEAVLESLAGRGPSLAEVTGVSNATVEGLSRLAVVMTAR